MTDPIKKDRIENKNEVNVDLVVKFLIENPNFFHENPDILNKIFLPHYNGSTVSLIEYQVATLKKSSEKTNNKLSELIENAKRNDHIFNVTKELIIDLINAPDINSAFKAITSKLKKTFPTETTRLLIILDKNEINDELIDEKFFRHQSLNSISLLNHEKSSLCGAIRENESTFIFGTSEKVLRSAAVSIRKFNYLGKEISILLAVGHHESDYFDKNTGTLFLDYLCEILVALIKKKT